MSCESRWAWTSRRHAAERCEHCYLKVTVCARGRGDRVLPLSRRDRVRLPATDTSPLTRRGSAPPTGARSQAVNLGSRGQAGGPSSFNETKWDLMQSIKCCRLYEHGYMQNLIIHYNSNRQPEARWVTSALAPRPHHSVSTSERASGDEDRSC